MRIARSSSATVFASARRVDPRAGAAEVLREPFEVLPDRNRVASLDLILERHRLRFVERPDHPWFVGCQFQPELRSRPTRPHPLFAGFIGAAVRASLGRADERERSQRAHAAG